MEYELNDYDAGKINKLMEDHLWLSRKFDELKEYARINFDLLVLSVDLENFPEVQRELDKVQKLIHTLMIEREEETFEDCTRLEEQNIPENEQSCKLGEISNNHDLVTTDVRNVRKSQRQARQSAKANSILQSTGKLVHTAPISAVNTKADISQQNINQGKRSTTTTSTTMKDSKRLKINHVGVCKKKIHKCAVCGKEFRMKKCLSLHNRTHEKESKNDNDSIQNSPVSVCAKDFKDKNSLQFQSSLHPKIHEETTGGCQYKCTMCGKDFQQKWKYNQHLKFHSLKSVRCSNNSDKLVQENFVEGERSAVMGPGDLNGKYEGVNKNDGLSQPPEEMKRKTIHKCDACGNEFGTKALLKSHCRIHDDGYKEKKADVQIQFCVVCDKQCKSKIAMLSHLRIHKNVNVVYTCALCGKEFHHKWRYNRHLLLHASQNSFICDFCGKTFKTVSNLRCHIALIHVKKYQQECKLCGKMFARMSNLTRHLRTHEGQKSYKCSVCNKAFSRGDNCRSHERKHDGHYAHPCSLCGKGFDFPSQLRFHETHFHKDGTPCSCSVCGETFASSAEAQSEKHCQGLDGVSHKLACSEVKGYKCVLCTARFNQKIPFAVHLLSAHAQNLDRCLVCDDDQIFSSAEELKLHLNSAHLNLNMKEKKRKKPLFNSHSKAQKSVNLEHTPVSINKME